MTKRTLMLTMNNPGVIKDWILKMTKDVPINKLKDCTVELTHAQRNGLFVSMGVAGGEKPTLFGIPVRLVPGSHTTVTLEVL